MVIRTYTPPKCKYEIEGKHIKTDGSVRDKVTGTALAGIFNISHWSSPFQIACRLLGLAEDADVGSKPSVMAGKVLEAPIIGYMDKMHSDVGIFVPAEDMYALRTGDHSEWPSDFEDEVFAGHVDGIVMADDGEDYILEVKTSSNMDDWVNGVPEYYYWQVALYNEFITHQDRAMVALGIMNEAALKDPESWVPNEGNCVLFHVKIDQDRVRERLQTVREWYEKYIVAGITPDYDPSNPGDVAMWEHLVGLTDAPESIAYLIEEDARLREEIARHEAEIRDYYDEKKRLDAKLKDYLLCHDLQAADSTSGDYRAVISVTTRKELDEEAMKADGIDPAKYKTVKISKTFTIKATKKEE